MSTESNVAELPVTDRLYAWFETNKKPVVGGAVAVATVGLLVWFVLYQKNQKEIAASNALSSVSASILSGASARSDSADAYLKVAASYPNSSAAARAVLLAATTLYTDGKFADAQTQFEKFTRTYQGNPLMDGAQLGVAACLDAQGKTDQSITAYKDLVTRHPNGSVIPQARLALGRLYESQGKLELAKDQYEEVGRLAIPYSTTANDAGMRLEELLMKNPKLMPAPAPAPVPVPMPALTLSNAPAKLEKK